MIKMGLPQRTVKIGEDTYKYYLVGGRKAFMATRSSLAKLTSLVPTLLSDKETDFSNQIMELVNDDYDNLWKAFINEETLYCNGELIQDIDEHFAGKFTDMPILLYKVIMENDKDFFASLPSLIKKGMEKLGKQQANLLPKADEIQNILNSVKK